MTRSEPRTKRQVWTRWLLAWVVLTLTGVAVHALAWVPPDRLDAGLSGIAEGLPVKAASNAVDVGVGPIWTAMAVGLGDWGVYSTMQTFAANGIAAALSLGILARLLRWRRRIDARLANREPAINPARRRFLIESPLALAGVAAGGPAIVGAFIEPFDLRLRRHRVPIRDLPTSLDGLRAAFISDTHLGPRIPASFIVRAIREAIELRPDLILLGGDYVHAGSRYIRPAVKLFDPLIASGIPIVGVLGNHDWYNSAGLIGVLMRDRGIRMVDNTGVFIDGRTRRIIDTPDEGSLCIAGVGDCLTDRVDLAQALAGVPAAMPRLLLSHNPDVAEMEELKSQRVDLMLCGHTHGGQVRIPFYGPMYIPCRHGLKYEGGMVQGPACRVLTSRGVGMSICPVRLGVPPELLEITLVRDPSPA